MWYNGANRLLLFSNIMYHPLAKEMQPSLNFFVLSPPTMQISYVVILMEG
jgi:hypothetical protein